MNKRLQKDYPMKQSEHAEKLCPIAQTLGIVGDSWTLLILRNCFMRTRRFDDFQQELGLTRHVLAERLKKLVAQGILVKVPQKDHASRFEYRLSPKGKALSPIFMALSNWGNEWLFEENEQPNAYRHNSCGKDMTPKMCCSECGEELVGRDIQMHLSQHTIEQNEMLSEQQVIEKFGFIPAEFEMSK